LSLFLLLTVLDSKGLKLSTFLILQFFQFLIVLPLIGFMSLKYLTESLGLNELRIYSYYSVCTIFGIFIYLAAMQCNLYLAARFFSSSLFDISLLSTNAIFVMASSLFFVSNLRGSDKFTKNVFKKLNRNVNCGVSLFTLILIVLAGFFPVYENDTLEYFGVAGQIKEFGLVNYPPINTTAEESLYAPSTHPPYFHLLISTTWEPGSNLLLFKFVYALFLIALLRLLSGHSRFIYSTILFFSIPICVFGFIGLHIDVFRLTFFTLGFHILMEVFQKERFDWRLNVVVATSSGLIVAPHSLGLVMLSLVMASIVIVKRKFFVLQLGSMLIGVAVFAPQYLLNTLNFGLPFRDGSVIQSMAALGFEMDLEQRRGLGSLVEKIFNGSLRGLFDFTLFGLVILLATFLAFKGLRLNHESLNSRIGVLCIMQLGFILIEILSALFGLNILIKNVRYYESIVPISILIVNYSFLVKDQRNEA
jgi:hypothetical protein